MPSNQPPLAELRNLGPKSQLLLASAGITTLSQLRELGAVAAYARVKQAGGNVCLNLLWALEGALTDLPWQVVAREHRTSLLLALEEHQRVAYSLGVTLPLSHAFGGIVMAPALSRTKDNPWTLKTPPGTSQFTMHMDEKEGKKILVCTVGSTVLHYDARCIDDLHAMLKKAGDWVELGGTDEQKSAKEGTVEAWGRSPSNPVGGWYGLKKGLRGRFGVYVPPLMEELGLCELEHNAKNNRMRAK